MQKKSRYAVFNYDKSDAFLIDELCQYLDRNIHNIYSFFEVDIPNKPIAINIIPTKQKFDKIYIAKRHLDANYVCPRWLVGACGDDIDLVSINDLKNTSHASELEECDKGYTKYCKRLVHEYIHFVNQLFNQIHNCSFTAKYLVEGIAVYLSHQKDGEKLKYDYTVEQLTDLNEEHSKYAGYYLTTKYFVENYDKILVLEMFQSSRQAKEFLEIELNEKATCFYNTQNAKL